VPRPQGRDGAGILADRCVERNPIMKTPHFRWVRFVLAASSFACVLAVPRPAAAQEADPSAEIAALKKQVAEQGRRISELEAEVKELMKTSSAQRAARQEESLPEHPARSMVASSTNQTAENSSEQKRIPSLPVHFGGDVYLYQYVPVDVPGAQPKFELYAFSALVDGHHGPWGFHVDYRFRTTKLRSFFPGNTWLQEGYVSYQTRLGQIKAGDFYRRVGLFWDDSFFGNIQYFDGLKLDPEFGVGFEGDHSFSRRLGADYSLQYFSTDSRVNGSLPGRDFVSEPGAHAKNDVAMRFAPVWNFDRRASLTLGGSFARGSIDRDNGPHNQRIQAAADATLKVGPWMAYGEILRQTVNGIVVLPPQDATYTLVGTRWTRGRFAPRLNFSQGDYHGLNGRREFIIQPGVTVELADGFSFLYEYDFWRSLAPSNKTTLDRSLNFVLHYHF
jgi:hypothetical protein